MKKIRAIIYIITFGMLSSIVLESCVKQTEDIDLSSPSIETFSDYVNSNYTNQKSITIISSFILQDNQTKIKKNSYEVKIDAIYSYLNQRGITMGNEDEIFNYLEANPEEIDSYIKLSSSETFYEFFSKINSVNNKESFYEEIMNDSILNNQEKVLLSLFIVQPDKLGKTVGFWDCVRRYAKLAEITAGTLFISLYEEDPQKAVDYATEELKKMGERYECDMSI